MKTTASCVEEILANQPFLEEALHRNIVNFSALAEELKPQVESMLKKSIKSGAIMMALRRYHAPSNIGTTPKLKQAMKSLGDITVRSDLNDFTFQNSPSLINSHSKILEQIDNSPNIFYAFTRGILESNIIISSSQSEKIMSCFKNEKQIGLNKNLSAISINLPVNNSRIPGLYYQIFKRLAWEGISLYEVVSTTNEFTVLVEDDLVDRAFSVIKNLKS